MLTMIDGLSACLIAIICSCFLTCHSVHVCLLACYTVCFGKAALRDISAAADVSPVSGFSMLLPTKREMHADLSGSSSSSSSSYQHHQHHHHHHHYIAASKKMHDLSRSTGVAHPLLLSLSLSPIYISPRRGCQTFPRDELEGGFILCLEGPRTFKMALWNR